MGLRFLLVALVASLGFDWPSGPELTGWTQPGRDWVIARLADLSATGSSPSEAPGANEPKSEARSTTTDLAFEVVVEKLAIDFVDDLAWTSANFRESDAPVPIPAVAERSGETGAATIHDLSGQLTDALQATRQAIGAWRTLARGTSASITRIH